MMSGVDCREVLWGCQASVHLFYFNITIACFCIVFYKVLRLSPVCYQRFSVKLFVFLNFVCALARCYLNYFDAFCVFVGVGWQLLTMQHKFSVTLL